MREILFRALSMCKGEHWLYGDIRHYNRNPHTEKWTIHDPNTGIETDIDEATIGQFTGLRDINGKDIYEGDILDVNYADEDSYLEVRFVRGVFAFLWNGDLDDEFPCNAPTHEWAKVIGNIYDNPKLLKRH